MSDAASEYMDLEVSEYLASISVPQREASSRVIGEASLHSGSLSRCRVAVPATTPGRFILKRDTQADRAATPQRVQNEHGALKLFESLRAAGHTSHIYVPRAYAMEANPDDLASEYLAMEEVNANLMLYDICGQPKHWSFATVRRFVRQIALFRLTLCQMRSDVIRSVNLDPANAHLSKLRGRVRLGREELFDQRYYSLGPYRDSREMAIAHMGKEFSYWTTAGRPLTAYNIPAVTLNQQRLPEVQHLPRQQWNYADWLAHVVWSKKQITAHHKYRSRQDELAGGAPFVLDHGDLIHGNNILMDADDPSRIACAIDWEMAAYVPYSMAMASLNTATLSEVAWRAGIYNPDEWPEDPDAQPFSEHPPIVKRTTNPVSVDYSEYLAMYYPFQSVQRGLVPPAQVPNTPELDFGPAQFHTDFGDLTQNDLLHGDRMEDESGDAEMEELEHMDYDDAELPPFIDYNLPSHFDYCGWDVDYQEDVVGGRGWFAGSVWRLMENYILEHVDANANIKKFNDPVVYLMYMGYMQPYPYSESGGGDDFYFEIPEEY